MLPCDVCNKTENKETCMNYKTCIEWRSWFASNWYAETQKFKTPVKAKPKTGIKWDERDIYYLTKYYHKFSLADIAEFLGRTPDAVYTKASLLGLIEKWEGCDNDCLNCKYPDCIKPYAET